MRETKMNIMITDEFKTETARGSGSTAIGRKR